MTPVLVAAIAGWATWGLLGPRHRFPWQVIDLAIDEPDAVDRRVERPSRGPSRRAARRSERAVQADLPGVVDLLHVAVSAGHPLRTAVAAVGRYARGPVGHAFAGVDRRVARGGLLAEELERLGRQLGPDVRPLVTTLLVAGASGAPIAPTLQRLADAERRRVRRRTEERVRRLPVVLLAPLIGLVLPAFVLSTVVPVVLTTASSLELPPATASTHRSPP